MTKHLTKLGIGFLFALGLTGYEGQQRPAGRAVAQETPREYQIIGCLQRGPEADSFVFTIQRSGEQIAVVGSEDLAKHVGHTVKLTGVVSGDVFKISDVVLVSEGCDS